MLGQKRLARFPCTTPCLVSPRQAKKISMEDNRSLDALSFSGFQVSEHQPFCLLKEQSKAADEGENLSDSAGLVSYRCTSKVTACTYSFGFQKSSHQHHPAGFKALIGEEKIRQTVRSRLSSRDVLSVLRWMTSPCRLLHLRAGHVHVSLRILYFRGKCLRLQISVASVRADRTDHSSHLSVSLTSVWLTKDWGSGSQCMSRSANPSLSLLVQHMDGATSEWFPKQPVTSTLPAAPLLAPTSSPWPTSPVLPPFSMLEVFTWPLDWSTELFSTFVGHPRLSMLSICYFVPPGHIRSIVLPPTSYSLIDTQSQGLSARLGCLYRCLPTFQHPSSMHTHTPVLL